MSGWRQDGRCLKMYKLDFGWEWAKKLHLSLSGTAFGGIFTCTYLYK